MDEMHNGRTRWHSTVHTAIFLSVTMSSGSFTCISCRVTFNDGDIQRAHYKTDWHRYNLKRKVAELPPVTAESFTNKVLAQRAQAAEDAADTSAHCELCNKHFNTKNAYENHIKSKKHKETELKKQQKIEAEKIRLQEKRAEKGLEEEILPQEKVAEKNVRNVAIKEGNKQKTAAMKKEEEQDMDTDEESVESWDGEALGLEECLFCSKISKSLEKNVQHMTKAHSFFIPDVDYLVDMEGLIIYLGEKVGEGHICLWCNEKSKTFVSTKSVQQHMIDKGHCKMLFEGDTVFEYSDFYDYRKSYPDYVEGAEQADEDEEMEVDGTQETGDDENYHMLLPSGASVGHRSLQRYYRQKLRPDRPHQLTPVNKLMSQYRALGWTGTTGAVAQQRAKDIAFVQRQKQKHHMKLGCKAHKLVNHFRVQVIF